MMPNISSIDYYNVYDSAPNYCAPLNSSILLTNSSSTSDGSAVKVTCVQGYQLSALKPLSGPSNVFQCVQNTWLPSTPRCVAAPGVPVGIIVGCTVGGVVCLTVILAAIYMLYRSRGEGLQEKQNDLLQKAKMMHLNFFMTSFQQDNVGMPAVTPDSVDCDLRGVTSQYPETTSYPVTSPEQTDDENFREPDMEFQENTSRSISRCSSVESITSAGDMETRGQHVDRL